MKKTILSELSAIRAILERAYPEPHGASLAQKVHGSLSKKVGNIITIDDDGTKSTSELLKSIGCPYWSYLSDRELDTQFPKVKTSRKFKYAKEADEDLKNMSANDLEKEGITCITLRERLIFEKLWFEKNGTHLDIDNITLCAGSRGDDDRVPDVYWRSPDAGLHVFSSHPAFQLEHLRSRAVSL